MSIYKQIAEQQNVEDYEASCEKMINMIEQAYQLLAAAKEIEQQSIPNSLASELDIKLPSIERVKHQIWRQAWRQAFDKTGLSQMMDRQAIADFDKALAKEPPEFTEANVRATFIEMSSKADKMFQRGVVDVFRNLAGRYRTHSNEPFKIPQKIIMRYMVSPVMRNFSIQHGMASDRVNDIDRVIKTLDGKRHEPRALEAEMNRQWCHADVFENEYYIAKPHKNNNLHLTFKRQDLLDRMNDLISDYYGSHTLAGGA